MVLAAGTAAAMAGCSPSSDSSTPAGGASAANAPVGTRGSFAPITPPSAVPVVVPTTPPAPPAPTPTPPPAPVVVRSVDPMVPGYPTVITQLNGAGSSLALTIDDGADSSVVAAYLQFIRSSRVKVTFFVNGSRPSWTEHKDEIATLIEAGLVQVANHTWSHPDITTISTAALRDELTRNETFIQDTWGVSGRPFFRPPFGRYNASTNQVAADLGYTMITMWWGSFGDAALLTEDVLLAQAQKWLLAQRIVIGHANYPTVTNL
ncbi:MAG: polysaccharide deacetylase, partial [Jatrophihabitantaceae bacterium]|nr:polysaccharide deacetylase [Jatrophihabitantaceae bacterium]